MMLSDVNRRKSINTEVISPLSLLHVAVQGLGIALKNAAGRITVVVGASSIAGPRKHQQVKDISEHMVHDFDNDKKKNDSKLKLRQRLKEVKLQ